MLEPTAENPAARRFRPIPRKVVYETVEGEVILIQLEQGNYFSLSGSGERIWTLLCAGSSIGEIGESLATPETEAATVATQVDELVERMLAEELLEPSDEEPAGTPVPDGGTSGHGVAAGSFEPPRLEKYEDMQDYLAVDPIHEVAEAGWPKSKPS